jgi:hypothetical protein
VLECVAPGLRQTEARWKTLEKPNTEAALEHAELLAHGRLRHAQTLGSSLYGPLGGRHVKVIKMIEVEHAGET